MARRRRAGGGSKGASARRTTFDPARLDELQRFAEEVSAPMFAELPGCQGYIYALAGTTWITQTFWDSAGSVSAAEQSARYRDVVDRITAAGFLEGDATTEVFEVTSRHLEALLG